MNRIDKFTMTKDGLDEFNISAASESPDPVLPRLKEKAVSDFESGDFPVFVNIPVKIGSEIDANFKLVDFRLTNRDDDGREVWDCIFTYHFLGCSG